MGQPLVTSRSSPTGAAEPVVIQHHSVHDEASDTAMERQNKPSPARNRVSQRPGAGDLRRRDGVSTARPTGPRRGSAAEGPWDIEICSARSQVHFMAFSSPPLGWV